MTEDEAIARLQAHIATPVPLSPEEQAALDRAMKNCYIDTCNEESLEAILQNTGHETDLETIFEKLAKLTAVPIASGKSREPVVFILDSLGALENKKC
ncbi:MAG: hypothetical protein IKA48_00455 [Fibrobacter sp.]|nr:hypothetical protein [Fibrobacter sp.]